LSACGARLQAMKGQTAICRGLIAAFLLISAASTFAGDLPSYTTPYYTIFTDVDKDHLREADIRMTKMAEEYFNRTREFSGAINQRMPFYLYANPEDYYATGAPRQSAGYFDGEKLVAMAGDFDARTWHVVQHEGFHQFAHFVIRGDLPMWVNEGMAEYFGEGLFTGDGFITGVIPQWRLQRVRKTLAAGKFKSVVDMMNLSQEQWNSELALVNYDQGWSMVHFLAHGENGRYQRAFGGFMTEIGKGRQWQQAWKESFGDTEGFEQRWRDYWSKLPDDPTADLYVQANVATLTSFLARAFSQHQIFKTFDDFKQAAEKNELKANEQDWLPPSLINNALAAAKEFTDGGCVYSIVAKGTNSPQVVCTLSDGRQFVGKFILRGSRVASVNVEIVQKKSGR
jgi:hypothetical protein